MSLEKRTPGGNRANEGGAGTAQQQYTANAAPSAFWKGWNGPASMAPPVIRKPAKVPDTLWRPERGRA